MASPHGLLLSWNSVIGERYFVQHTPSLASPVIWTNVGNVVATTPLTTFEITPAPTVGYYRIVQVYSIEPVLVAQPWPTNMFRLSWSAAFPDYILQYRLGFFGPWSNLVTHPNPPYPSYPPPIQEGNELAAYDMATNAVPKFYRLFK